MVSLSSPEKTQPANQDVNTQIINLLGQRNGALLIALGESQGETKENVLRVANQLQQDVSAMIATNYARALVEAKNQESQQTLPL